MPEQESSKDDNKPFTIIVDLDINPEMMEEFIKVNKIDVDESRKEAGCLRFDTIKNIRSKTKYTLYMGWKSKEAFKHHQNTPHYKKWLDFEAMGGVISK